MAVYLQASPSEPTKQLDARLGVAITDILKDRGIPAEYIKVASSIKLGSVPTLGESPVVLANSAGFNLYSDHLSVIRLASLVDSEKSIGTFTQAELASDPVTGDSNPLSANRIVVDGILSRVDEADVEYKVETETPVRGGIRKVIKEYKVGKRKIIETETIKEPKSQVSTFSQNFEAAKDPDKLIQRFNRTVKSPSVTSQTTTVTTEVDKDNLLKSRTKIVTGMAAKGLSKFFAAWAGAELPPPVTTEEESTSEPVDSTIEFQGSGSVSGDYDYTPTESQSTSSALTLAKPSGMFNIIDLEFEEEEWEWDLDDEIKPITNPNTKTISFGQNRGKCVYSRVKYLPIGAILPEIGNPIIGYQVVQAGLSNPKYRDGSRMVVAEKEVITYTQEDSGDWVAERRLEQAIGVRNAQEPLDAMRSVQFTDPEAQAREDRSNVALNVASQLTLAINERIRSSPPAPLEIDDTKRYTKTRPYKFTIEMGSEDLLDRSIQISPTPYVPSIPAIADFARYQSLITRGQAKQLTFEMPIEGLSFDIPPMSLLNFNTNTFFVNQLKVTLSAGKGLLTLTCYPW